MIIQDLLESQQQCPECGGPAFSDLILAEKKDACYHKVKASAKVWPSAYASGRLVQCRNKGAANWGNKSKNESVEQGVAEGAMPASVIKAKESIRLASDEENKKRFAGKTKAELAQMARRHGYKDKNPYAKFHDGVTESTQGVAETKGEMWRVMMPRAQGGHSERYYVVKGYNKDLKIWKNKSGAGDFNDRADAEAKADELNKSRMQQRFMEFAPVGAGGGNTPRGPRTPGDDPWGGDDSGEDPYGKPQPRHYARSSSYFEQFEADHFDDEIFDAKTGVFKGYWDDQEGRVQIAYFKFDDPARTGGDDPGMGWYYEPQNESVAEKLGNDRPTLGTKRDAGKSVRKWRKERGLDEQGAAPAANQSLSVQQLAAVSDEALDKAYGYGRSTPGNTFGWQANLMSAAYAKKMIESGVTDIEVISDAIHKGWNVTAQKFVQNPEQFDDSAKLQAAGKLEAKVQQRAQLMKQNYAQLPEEEKEKDRVVARALLQAIGKPQGVEEAAGNSPEILFYAKLPDGYKIYARVKDQQQLADLMKKYAGKEIKTFDFNDPEIQNWLEARRVNPAHFPPGMVQTVHDSVYARGSRAPSIAENNMPITVISFRKKLASMSPGDFATRFKDRSDQDLRSMARRHALKDLESYVNKRKKGQAEMAEGQKWPDTDTSLADRTLTTDLVPGTAKTASGHPIVRGRFRGERVATRVDPSITPTSVQRKDADQKPIPSFLKKQSDLDEGGDVFAPGIQNTPEYKAGFATGKLPVPHPEGSQEYAAYYKGVIDKATPNLNKASMEEASGDPDIKPGMKTAHGTVLAVNGNTVTVQAPNGDKMTVNIHDIQTTQGVDESSKKEADYGGEYQDMVARLKQLAGQGPRKTVWDPAKRVYKTVPTAVQPGDKK